MLAVDCVGLYHFLEMVNRGHEIRDRIGFTEESADLIPQTNGIKEVWSQSASQNERTIHGVLVAASMVAYTATATIELTLPRMSTSTSPLSNTHLHKYAFWLHAGLMAANVLLGFAESNALSAGNHDLVQGLGIAHLVVGFSVPVVMVGAGMLYKLPNDY